MKTPALIICIIILFAACSEETKDQVLLSERPSSSDIFAPNFISTHLYERDIAVHPKGNEIIYTLSDHKQKKRCLVCVKLNEKGIWTSPELLNISGKHQDLEPFLANEGNRLYFVSDRPVNNDTSRTDFNIWYSERTENQWSEPIAFDDPINTENDEYYPSLSKNGNLYFTSVRDSGYGKEDIYFSELIDGLYLKPELLDSNINSSYYEFNAFISPDEDVLIFGSFGREDGFGGGDLYISKKDAFGNWTPGKNMGEAFNTEYLDYCPFIDYERKNFYFSSDRTNLKETEIRTAQDLINYSEGILNGNSNIYRIKLERLDELIKE